MSRPRRSVIKLIAILLIASIISLNTEQAHGQNGIVVENIEVSVNFGESITFSARIKAPMAIKQASLLFRGVNEEVTRVETLQVAEDGSVSHTYDASLNIFPPFSSIVFWFQATLADDKTYTSEPVTFPYNDNRFPWRTISRENLTVQWYAGDNAFGSAALDAAGAGMHAMQEFISVSLTDPINIYIYSNETDLQNTLLLGGAQWAGGHTSPELGLVLVAVAPGSNQSIELETKIPHELTHVMMYRELGENYARQPAWLLEGIAAMAELYPNLEYKRALDDASQNNTLLAFNDLCASFPADAGNAFLAYAQSQSFVTYIRDSYGTSGLTRLTQSYGEGFDCELGATNALGTPLSQLEVRWRESVLGQNVTGVAIRNLIPFVLLLALVLVVPLWGAVDLLRQRRKRGIRA
ncbi:MAG TPA: peptidase MA family metallohydrolase [Anaerolineales bacterium]|nr:peptidase MA family metallohydrolase [Anaerolineales bacterium]